MYLIVLFVAIFVISISLSTIIMPVTLRNTLKNFLKKNWLWPVSALRIMLGTAFLLGAEETEMPNVVTTVGIIMIFAGISVPLLGKDRIEAMAQWWMNQKDWMIRIWGFIALILGICLALAGLPS